MAATIARRWAGVLDEGWDYGRPALDGADLVVLYQRILSLLESGLPRRPGA